MITLTDDEARVVLLALMAVSPSGGSSRFHALARKIARDVGPWPTDEEIVAVQIRVSNELDEALLDAAIVPVPAIEGRI